MSQHMSLRIRVPIEPENPSIERIESLCVKCGLCAKVCRDPIGVLDKYDLQETGDKAVLWPTIWTADRLRCSSSWASN